MGLHLGATNTGFLFTVSITACAAAVELPGRDSIAGHDERVFKAG